MAQTDINVVLTKATTLSADQIKMIMRYPSPSQPRAIGDVLAVKDYPTADDLVAELCRELGLEFIKDIPVNDISSDLIRNIPINYAKTQGILPYKEEADLVVNNNQDFERGLEVLEGFLRNKLSLHL